ncbi:MAG: hypothetical protein GC134_01440 [Proteobacteria bacterium]|nr:hypothetical protein [Pseudomonadota bacterium]
MISNCASCGYNAYADPVTGIVRRKDEVTGAFEPASVQPLGQLPDSTVATVAGQDTLSSGVLSASLAVQEGAAPARIGGAYIEQPQIPAGVSVEA